jgi:uncharacterized iron-regulated protein
MRYLTLLLLICPWLAIATPVYTLNVDINPQKQQLKGIAEIQSSTPLTLETDGMIILSDKREADGLRRLVFEYQFKNQGDFINDQHVILHNLWYPRPTQLVQYRFSARLPQGFIAVSEANKIDASAPQSAFQQRTPDKTGVFFRFSFARPLDNLTLIASNQYQVQTAQYRDIQLETYFLPDNAPLAADYLQRSQEYLALYEKLLTPYPFKRFAIVENPFPTGYAMPTYTLLGSRVIPLPFILDTSLGHEILHQWFGNLVYIDFAHGNWAEGLTHYLAEHWYAEQRGEGVAFRKNILSNYAAYPGDMAVRDFRSRHNRAASAVGYGKVAMIFHTLRSQLGDDKFFTALRRLIANNQFRAASWHDIQRAFDSVSDAPLFEFFQHWLTRSDIPAIEISQPAQLSMHQGQLSLAFSLRQNTPLYPLRLPLQIHNASGTQTRWLDFSHSEQDFRLALEEPPLRVVVDENMALMRQLDSTESLPNIAKILGDSTVIAAVSNAEQARYQPVLDGLGITHSVNRADVTFAQLRHNSLLIAGFDNYMVRMLFGAQSIPTQDVALDIRPNPYHPGKVIALLHVKDSAAAQAVSRKLSHYGQYAKLAFANGRAVQRQQPETAFGLELFSALPTRAVEPAKTADIDALIPRLADKRVIFIGEQHTRFEHHLNQYLIIKKLHEAGHKVAIGMEMFQQPYQQALDDYLANKISEAEFLQQSQYFEKWRYDYNLYKIIIDYAKAQSLPIIALNIDSDIHRKLGGGGIPALSREEQAHLPDQLDVSNAVYAQDLADIYAMHPRRPGSDFDFFLQSQVAWDESMAQTAAEFLANTPDTTLVILAGSGHVRYGHGIPQRIERRTGLPYSIIVQDEELSDGIADYVLITQALSGTETPLMGIFVETREHRLVVSRVSPDSVAAKAGIEAGDIVLNVDGKPVANLSDLKIALLYADLSKAVSAELEREGKIFHKQLNFSAPQKHHP